jgi:plastocyanin
VAACAAARGPVLCGIGPGVAAPARTPFPHTATGAGFDSKSIAAGQSWTFTPPRPGEYAYVCALHPAMKATLRVR